MAVETKPPPLPQSPTPEHAPIPAAAPRGAERALPQSEAEQPAPVRAPRSAAELWSGAIDLAAGSVRTQSMLREGRPVSWEGAELVVEVGGPTRAVIEHRREEVEGLLRRVAGRKVSLVVRAPAGEGEPADAPPPASAEELAREHPLVKHAIELFGGRVDKAYFKKQQ